MPFVIFALPRSRTAWLSKFLTYADWSCGHEEILHVRSLDDIKAWLNMPNTGTAETAAAPWWRTIQDIRPDTKIVVVRRPVEEVVNSFYNVPGVNANREVLTEIMVKLDHKLDQIEKRMSNVLSVKYDDLKLEDTCKQVFEHCLPYQHDHAWWELADKTNIQIDLPKMIRYYEGHKPQLDKLAAQMKWYALKQIAFRPIKETEGLSIQEECFDTWYRDGKETFEANMVALDEIPENYLHKSFDLFKKMAEIGALQIVTARSNGKVFGYLLTILSPSLDGDWTTAVNATFYASPDFPGVGMKLQRHVRDLLKQKGIKELVYRAGIRGDGPRTSIMYRRLGAERYGELFRLQLQT